MTGVSFLGRLPAPGTGPAGLAWDSRCLWLNDYRDGGLYRVDLARKICDRVMVCAGAISGLTWDGTSLWQTRLDEPYLQCINPTSTDFEDTIVLQGYRQLTDAAWDGRALWVLWQYGSRLLRVDRGRGQVEREVAFEGAAGPLAFGQGLLWLARAYPMAFDPGSGSHQWTAKSRRFALQAIDPESGDVKLDCVLPFFPTGMEWIGEDLWLSDPNDRVLHRCRLH
jgi:hypothetical protein